MSELNFWELKWLVWGQTTGKSWARTKAKTFGIQSPLSGTRSVLTHRERQYAPFMWEKRQMISKRVEIWSSTLLPWCCFSLVPKRERERKKKKTTQESIYLFAFRTTCLSFDESRLHWVRFPFFLVYATMLLYPKWIHVGLCERGSSFFLLLWRGQDR